MGWALGPEVESVDALRLGAGWLGSAIGRGDRRCPDCGDISTSHHSWHDRQLQDLPVQGARVTLKLRLRRWRCRKSDCARKTFVERLVATAGRRARRTHRVVELVRLLGHTTGGRPGERLMRRLAMPTSRDTILRHLKRHVAERRAGGALRVVGIDDWSWRKGATYGTIMVDLERREVVDSLEDRSAKGTAQWLQRHPGIEIVSRDRCGLYAQGARQGAPRALQVADRFHLLQNFRQAIEQQLSREPRLLSNSTMYNAGLDDVGPSLGPHAADPEVAEHRALARDGRRAVWRGMFDRVKGLQIAGASLAEIVRDTGYKWRTVAKWARLDALPERSIMAPKLTTPDLFQNHLARRWTEGCTTGRHLLPEIKRLGYTGSLSHLERLLSKWRRGGEIETIPVPIVISVTVAGRVARAPIIPPNLAAALCLKPRALLTQQQREKVDRLIESVDFAIMRQSAMRFRGILRGGQGNRVKE